MPLMPYGESGTASLPAFDHNFPKAKLVFTQSKVFVIIGCAISLSLCFVYENVNSISR
jgi:hypothetical protein